MELPYRVAIGAGLALIVVAGGVSAGALSKSGAAASFVVGTVVFGLGGPAWGVLLIASFVSASALSAYREDSKATSGKAVMSKGGRRDANQVLANTGVAALIAALSAIAPDAHLFAAYVGALSAVTADTWATELGMLSRIAPRLITSGDPVPPGTSGGVTVLGTSAATVAGVFMGIVAAAFVALDDAVSVGTFDLRLLNLSDAARIALIAPIAALAGTAFDSYLGATVQAKYMCPKCFEPTERRVHDCGTETDRVSGWRWMDNDAVNLLASIVGAAVGFVVYQLI